jgi:hypothetical protein
VPAGATCRRAPKRGGIFVRLRRDIFVRLPGESGEQVIVR